MDHTQLVYGPAEPQLIENMRYAWRVRAVDTQGRDAFRNNGYSEVCTFTYGGIDPAFIIGGIAGLQAEGESERSARIWWGKGNFDSYRIHYKKSGQGHEWFTSDLLAKDLDPAKEEGELKLFDLEPDTEYETRAQAKKMGSPGPYTDIVKFRTLPVRVAHCGDPAQLPEGDPGEPYREAIKGMTIDVDGMEMALLDVVHLGDGWYKGLGRVSVDYLGGAAFTASFDRIFINTDRQVVLGRIDFVTKGPSAMAEGPLAAQEKREREAEGLAVNSNGNEGKDIIFEGVIDSVYVDEKGEIVIIDTEGERFVYEQTIDPVTGEKQAVNIVDGGGNGYVVDGEGKVSKGSGNTPGGSTETDSVLFVQKELIKEVLEYYEEEINLWLENNGKGPLAEALVRRLYDLPDCLPEDENILEEVLAKIEEYLENSVELLNLVLEDESNKTRIEELTTKLTGKQPPYAAGLSEAEWGELLEMVCTYLLPEEEKQIQYILPLTVYLDDDYYLIDPDKTEFNNGDTITVESYMAGATLFLKDAEGRSIELLSSHFPDNAGEVWPPGFTVDIEELEEGELEEVKILIPKVDTLLVYIEKYKPALEMSQSDILALLADINEAQKDDMTTYDLSLRLTNYNEGDISGDLDKAKVNDKYEVQSLKLKLTNQSNTEISLEM